MNTKRILETLCIFLCSYGTMSDAVFASENEKAEKLLLAYDDYRASWLPSELMIWCTDDTKKFKLSKNAFGKETLYLLTNSNWKPVRNVNINGYAITWIKRNQTIALDDIVENKTICEGKSSFQCFQDNMGVRGAFINIWKKNYHPSLVTRDFSKYFTITSTSDLINSIRIDTGWFSTQYDENIQKISVTVSENVSNPPDGLRRQTVDEYELNPRASGPCRVVD